jgi:hypothetical protein
MTPATEDALAQMVRLPAARTGVPMGVAIVVTDHVGVGWAILAGAVAVASVDLVIDLLDERARRRVRR